MAWLETWLSPNDTNDRLLTETLDSVTPGADRHTVYSYSVTEQTAKDVYEGLTSGGTLLEEHSYEYNLQGRQFKATVTKDGSTTVIETLYDDSGIRIRTTETVDGGTPKVTEYVIDAQNHTGYAQVLEEHVDGVLVKTYTLGHDTIAQQSPSQANGDTLTFLYDGHGSTRALLDALGAIVQRFSYDAYGNILVGAGLTTASAAYTTHLYAGEQFDARTGLSYNRARYYSPATGTFNRLDPWAGNVSDPQSLHKYLYTHVNPVMGTDPSGLLTLANVIAAGSLGTIFGAIGGAVIGGIRDGARGAVNGFAWGAVFGAGAAVAITTGGALAVAPLLGVSQLSGIFITHTIATGIFSGFGIHEAITADTDRDRVAAIAGVVMTLGLWGYGAYRFSGVRVGRGTFENLNPNASAEEIAAGRFLASRLKLDLVAQVPTGARGPGTSDFMIRLGGGKTIELKNFSGVRSASNLVSKTLDAQSENVAVIIRPGNFSATDLARFPNRVFGNREASIPKQNIWIIEEAPNGYRITDHYQRY